MTKPNLKEIEWAISDLEEQETSENRYILLAALHICRDHMLGYSQTGPAIAAYSEAAAAEVEVLGQYGDSEFLRAAAGKDPAKVLMVIDDLLDALQVVNRRAYDNVMRKLDML